VEVNRIMAEERATRSGSARARLPRALLSGSLTRLEEGVRRYWRWHGVPAAALTARSGGPTSIAYLQPLLVVGQPPADLVRLLVAFDLLVRYRTMRGETVQRRVGWAGHGLPVEVAVEHSLGDRADQYDLASFNAACHEAARAGQARAEALAEWLGLWLEADRAYATPSLSSTGRVWREFHHLWKAGYVSHQQRLAPVCPRCATCLSEAEATRRLVERRAASIWLHLPWEGEPGAYFLLWTPIPWALVGMVALAAHPEASYALVELEPEEDGSLGPEGSPLRLLVAESALDGTFGGSYRVLRRIKGRSLRGARYHPPFTFAPLPEGAGRLVLDESLPLDRGTGLLPVLPTFDALSLQLAQAHDLPVPELVDGAGKFNDAVRPWRGLAPMESEDLVIDDLRARGLLFRRESRSQVQALCPYCGSPLLYRAWPVWLLATGGGPWIVGRNRPWGTPLPIWRCEQCGRETCITGPDDLARRTGLDVTHLELHRPAVDALAFACAQCGGTMRRTAEVLDAAFEAAVLPWASSDLGGPQAAQRSLAVGLGDKHLDWLGDMTEMAALLRGSLAWEQAVALPQESEAALEVEQSTPADALRWAAYAGTTPEEAEGELLQPLRRLAVLALNLQEGGSTAAAPSPPLWSAVATLPPPGMGARPATFERRPASGEGTARLLDRWFQARLQRTTFSLTKALDGCDIAAAARCMAELVHDFTAWYAPHRPTGIGPALASLAVLLAPFAPHLAEALYSQGGQRAADSVHLLSWPAAEGTAGDEDLLAGMALLRRLAALGQAARAQAGIPLDRPLRRAWVAFVPPETEEPLLDETLLAQALGVGRVRVTADALSRVGWHLDLAPREDVGRFVPAAEVDAALAALVPEARATLLSQLWSGRSAGLDVAGRAVTLLPDEVEVSLRVQPGFAAAFEPGLLLVLEVDDW